MYTLSERRYSIKEGTGKIFSFQIVIKFPVIEGLLPVVMHFSLWVEWCLGAWDFLILFRMEYLLAYWSHSWGMWTAHTQQLLLTWPRIHTDYHQGPGLGLESLTLVVQYAQTTLLWTASVHLYMDFVFNSKATVLHNLWLAESVNTQPQNGRIRLARRPTGKLYVDFHCRGLALLTPAMSKGQLYVN